MLKTRIAVLASGNGTNLQALIDAQNDGTLKSGEIATVISNVRDAYAQTRAKNAGIPAVTVCKTDYKSAGAFESALVNELNKAGADLIILAGFMTILSKSFTDLYKNRIINVHPSLIPAFCGRGFYGLKVHEAALSYGVKVTGATVHFVNEIPDGGKIIMQKAVDVLPNDTPKTLQRRVMEQAEWLILPAAAELIAADIMRAGEGNTNGSE